MQPGRARTSGFGLRPLLLARRVGWVVPVWPTQGVLALSCPSAALRVHVCTVSWDTWLLFTGVPARCVALRVPCPGPLGCCSPVCPLGVLCCVCGLLGHLAPVHRCAPSLCCFSCAVSWATWLLFAVVPAPCVVWRVRCRGPLGSCSSVCPLGVLCCVCGVLCHLAPVHRCARSVRCFGCALSWATWLLFTAVPAWCVAFRLRCPGPLGSCSPVCPRGFLCCVCGVPSHLAPVERCAGSVSLCCVCRVLGHLAPVHRCARSVLCFACAVSWATWLVFTGVPALCAVWRLRCRGPLGSCSPACPLGVLCCLCGVLGHLAAVHRCARPMCCVACAVSCATWLLFTGVPAQCVALGVGCPGPVGSCSPVCPLGALLSAAVSRATWLLFNGAPAWFFVLLVRCPEPLGSCSAVFPLCVLCCVCGVLGHVAPVHRCASSVRCFACAVSWATWLLFPGVPARCVVLLLRRRGPLGSCSSVCALCPLLCSCGVLGHLTPVHQCAGSVCCIACVVSSATWLLFTGVLAPCVALCVLCPGPLGSCSLVCRLGV